MGTEHAGAARTSVQPKDEVISVWFVFGSDEEVVAGDAGSGLEGEIATVHGKLFAEIVVSFELSDLILGRKSNDC